MEKERRRARNTANQKDTQLLDVGNCTYVVQRASVGEDHAKDCPLYRRRGSGLSVLTGPREQGQVEWYSANGHAHLGRRKRKHDE